MKRKLSMLLILSMLAAMVVSCGGGGDGEDTKGTSTVTTEGPAVDASTRLDLDPELNYDGTTFTIISFDQYFAGSNDEAASALDRAEYMQQAKTAERLGVEFNLVTVSPHTEIPGRVTQSINTQTDDYQLVLGTAHTIVGLVNSGYFVPVEELIHADMDKVWWNLEYSKSQAVNENHPYILFGDLSYSMIERSCALLFNKELLLEQHGMSDSELYDIVLDGDWTIDKFVELAEGVFIDDGDGNTTNDIDDTHGIAHIGYADFEYLIFSTGVDITSRDENGYPVLPNAPTERMITLVDKLLPVFTSEATFKTDGTSFSIGDYADKQFAEGKALFVPNRLFVAGFATVQEMEDDFGIIPMPKYDETIDGYYTAVANNVIWGLVPTTVEDVDMVSAVVESLAYDGYNDVTPTYYEENLKLKYTRGEDVDTQSEILDLIRYGARTDFLYINRLGGLGDIYTKAWQAKTNNIVSTYASFIGSAEQNLASIIATLEG